MTSPSFNTLPIMLLFTSSIQYSVSINISFTIFSNITLHSYSCESFSTFLIDDDDDDDNNNNNNNNNNDNKTVWYEPRQGIINQSLALIGLSHYTTKLPCLGVSLQVSNMNMTLVSTSMLRVIILFIVCNHASINCSPQQEKVTFGMLCSILSKYLLTGESALYLQSSANIELCCLLLG